MTRWTLSASRSLGCWAAHGLALLAILSFAACGETVEPEAEEIVIVCDPGSTQMCLGAGACEGAQVCVADGSGFGACDCGSSVPSPQQDSKGDEADSSDPMRTPVDDDDDPAVNADPNEPDPNEPDPNEPDPNEPDPNEPDPNEPDPNEPDPNEPDPACPMMGAGAWAAGANVIVESVDFQLDRVVLRNVTNFAIPLDGWVVFLGDKLLALEMLSGFEIAPGGTFHVHLRESGTSTTDHAYWGGTTADFDLTYNSGDVSVHTSYAMIDSPTSIQAYMRWGTDPMYASADHHRDEAAAVGLWNDIAGAYIPTQVGDVGIVAVGDVSNPNGYAAVAPNCMP